MNVVKDDRDWDKVAVARFWSPFDLKVSSITSSVPASSETVKSRHYIHLQLVLMQLSQSHL